MKNGRKFLYIFGFLFFIFVVSMFYIYIRTYDTFIIKDERDLIYALEETDYLPYRDEEIYETKFKDGLICVLYKNKRFDGYFIFRAFEEDNLFKDRYRSIYFRDNNPLDSNLNCEYFKGDDYSIGFVYGINLNSKTYNTVVQRNDNGKEVVTYNFNNLSGNFIHTIKSGKHSSFMAGIFSSQENQNRFINEVKGD